MKKQCSILVRIFGKSEEEEEEEEGTNLRLGSSTTWLSWHSLGGLSSVTVSVSLTSQVGCGDKRGGTYNVRPR